jgi:PQQ-dependent catabolism-associated CXXCW motif protein
MSGAERVRKRAAALAIVAALMPGVALAQAGDFGGSFEDGAAAEPPAWVPQPSTAPDDAFGGSFEGTDIDPMPDPLPSEPDPAPAPGSAPPVIIPPAPDAADDAAEAEAFDPGFGLPGDEPGPPRPDERDDDPGQIRIDSQITAFELRDFGVPPVPQLRQGDFSAPTPTSVPGGHVVTTEQLANAINQGMPLLLVDVLGGTYNIPGSFVATPMGGPGTFYDATQQQTAMWLYTITGGNLALPIVLYCSDPMCWMSYNASLRAIASGFSNVYWYRGGLQAWQMSALPLVPSGF